MPAPSSHCPTCGATINEYRHPLSRPMMDGLLALRLAGGGPINLKHLGLTRNQWDNFQKLRYFDLVVPVTVDGRRKKGVWAITDKGLRFLDGTVRCRSVVWTYRGNRTTFDGPLVKASEVISGYQTWEIWADEARRHGDGD